MASRTPKSVIEDLKKMEVPQFNGNNVEAWASKLQKSFDTLSIPLDQRIMLASQFMEGPAYSFYEWAMRIELVDGSWSLFLTAVLIRFRTEHEISDQQEVISTDESVRIEREEVVRIETEDVAKIEANKIATEVDIIELEVHKIAENETDVVVEGIDLTLVESGDETECDAAKLNSESQLCSVTASDPKDLYDYEESEPHRLELSSLYNNHLAEAGTDEVGEKDEATLVETKDEIKWDTEKFMSKSELQFTPAIVFHHQDDSEKYEVRNSETRFSYQDIEILSSFEKESWEYTVVAKNKVYYDEFDTLNDYGLSLSFDSSRVTVHHIVHSNCLWKCLTRTFEHMGWEMDEFMGILIFDPGGLLLWSNSCFAINNTCRKLDSMSLEECTNGSLNYSTIELHLELLAYMLYMYGKGCSQSRRRNNEFNDC